VRNTQISFDEDILEALDRAAASSHKTRSFIVREAVREWLERREVQDFEEQWIEKLHENPEQGDEAEAWIKVDRWGNE